MCIPSKKTKVKKNCFCQDFLTYFRKPLEQKLTDHQILETLKERLKNKTIKFDYDIWGREIGLDCEDYELSFAEFSDWPSPTKLRKKGVRTTKT